MTISAKVAKSPEGMGFFLVACELKNVNVHLYIGGTQRMKEWAQPPIGRGKNGRSGRGALRRCSGAVQHHGDRAAGRCICPRSVASDDLVGQRLAGDS